MIQQYKQECWKETDAVQQITCMMSILKKGYTKKHERTVLLLKRNNIKKTVCWVLGKCNENVWIYFVQ